MKRLLALVVMITPMALGEAASAGDEAADLRAQIRRLEAENRVLRSAVEALRGERDRARDDAAKSGPDRLATELRLMGYLDRALREKPEDVAVRAEAAQLARRLAPQVPGNRMIWGALIRTGVLKDGMTIEEAEAVLGPATSKADGSVIWYFNPRNRHVAPRLMARREPGKDVLTGWTLTNA